MRKGYRSGIDAGLVLLVLFFTLLPVLPLILAGSDLWIVVILLSVAIFEIATFTGFRYTIDGTKLTVTMLYVVKNTYDIGEIVEVKSTNTILSSPAASMDRLAISFKGRRSPLVISPKNKHAFVEDLVSINPDIRVLVQ